jgi:hypothetical protein
MLSTLFACCCRLLRPGLSSTIVGAFLLAPSAALADREKRVESSTTTIELAADGSASVRHELVLEVHGAPFTQLTLRGVDADAEPLPDATLTRLSRGPGSGIPEPVLVQAHAGQLDVRTRSPRGQRGTSFLLRVGYRTRLVGAVRPLPDGLRSELGWVGPRFDDGVDAVTLILRTRAAEQAPDVAPDESGGPSYGMVMSTLRRSRDLDELELVRAHVARDEAIRWSVRLDRALFDVGAETGPQETGPRAAAPSAAPSAAPLPNRERPAPDSSVSLGLAAAGLAYAILVWLKARAVAAASALRACTPRPWLGMSAPWRALLAGGAVVAAGALSIAGQPPLLGALALLLAMAFAAHHRPRETRELRGPGEWRPIEPSALEPTPAIALPGAWLDAGRARGGLLMLAALGGIGALAARVFGASPYNGACLLLGSCVLLPIFCTGRAGELPPDALAHARDLLGDVARRLGRDATLVVKAIGRVAAANGELDELRLSIASVRPVPGLLGIELGLELREQLGGHALRPVLVVRAAEGSECQRTLPRGITWMRGRNADERASLIRPKLPSAASCVALIQELWALLLAPPAPAEPASKKAARSAGNGLTTANAGTRSSPAHAT